jgi:hypothetical protein
MLVLVPQVKKTGAYGAGFFSCEVQVKRQAAGSHSAMPQPI